MPSDPAKRAVYEAQLERYQEKKEAEAASRRTPNRAAGSGDVRGNHSDSELTKNMARRREDRLYADLKAEDLLDLPPTSA